MLKVVTKSDEVELFSLSLTLKDWVNHMPTVPILIMAGGRELQYILDNFSGIRKTSADVQIFLEDDAEFILRNWNYV